MKVSEEQAKRLASQYLFTLEEESMQLLNHIHELQQKYNMMKTQIQGLRWFISPELNEIAASKEIIAVLDDTEEVATTDAKIVKDAVATILEEIYPKSIHYVDLLEMLKSIGITLPGKDPKQNLLSYLSRDDRFERSENRGEYRIKVKGIASA